MSHPSQRLPHHADGLSAIAVRTGVFASPRAKTSPSREPTLDSPLTGTSARRGQDLLSFPYGSCILYSCSGLRKANSRIRSRALSRVTAAGRRRPLVAAAGFPCLERGGGTRGAQDDGPLPRAREDANACAASPPSAWFVRTNLFHPFGWSSRRVVASRGGVRLDAARSGVSARQRRGARAVARCGRDCGTGRGSGTAGWGTGRDCGSGGGRPAAATAREGGRERGPGRRPGPSLDDVSRSDSGPKARVLSAPAAGPPAAPGSP
jgi:hypothetical protein